LRLAHSEGLNRVGVSLPSPEEGAGCSIRNVVFLLVFRIRTMYEIQKVSDSVYREYVWWNSQEKLKKCQLERKTYERNQKRVEKGIE
jgi:hypothetical protein